MDFRRTLVRSGEDSEFLLIKFRPACACWQPFFHSVELHPCWLTAFVTAHALCASPPPAAVLVTTPPLNYVLNCVSVASGEQTVKFQDLVHAMHGMHHGNSMLATPQSCTWESTQEHPDDAHVCQVFKYIEQDGQGSIGIHNATAYAMGLVHPDIEQQISAIMIAHDPDKNNKLSYDDFLQAIHEAQTPPATA